MPTPVLSALRPTRFAAVLRASPELARRLSRTGALGAALALLTTAQTAPAEVYDVTFSDVTPRAFSVIWMSDVPVGAATVRVFSDPDGLDEVTADLDIQTVSADRLVSHDRGIVKVDVVGLLPDTVYYVLTQTESRDDPPEVVESPSIDEPLLQVQTAVSVTVSQAADASLPIANDLYLGSLFDPDGVDAPDGGLMLVRAPGLSVYPISAFVGDGTLPPDAVADLNNLFGDDGYSVQVPAGEPLEIVEFRGSVCAPGEQMLVRKRRAPTEPEPPLTELLQADSCFAPQGVAADHDCNGRVGLADFGAFAARYGHESLSCAFNDDYDFDANGRVGLSDFGLFASVYGAEEPAE